jgi:hypothetical protein
MILYAEVAKYINDYYENERKKSKNTGGGIPAGSINME